MIVEQGDLFAGAASSPANDNASRAAAKTTCELRHGRWQDVLRDVECDTFLSDPPYSARTHAAYVHAGRTGRRSIDYASLSEQDVADIVTSWAPRTKGWFVVLTDHVLAPAWARELERTGRYVFSPVACVTPGGRVRLQGDGPAQWSVWAVVARRKTRRAQAWGALPGAYVVPPGFNDRKVEGGVTGGKPLWLMQALVRDYSCAGDLVCDPFAGGGTSLIAARIEQRSCVGAEVDRATYELAQRRLDRPYTPTLFDDDQQGEIA